MLTWYSFLLFFHIAMAIVWIGAAVTMQLFYLRVEKRDGRAKAAFASDAEWIGMRIITPVALGALLSGILLVVDGAWSFGDDWIVIGLVLFGLTFLAGALFFGPESGRIAQLIETEGPGSPQVDRRIDRVLRYSRLDAVLLFLLVFDMAVKPSFEDPSGLIFGLAAAAAAAALFIWRSSAARSRPTAAD